MEKEFFGEKLHDYEYYFDFYEIIPSTNDIDGENDSVYVCGSIIRIFSYVFFTEGVSGLEDGLSFCTVASWEKCLDKLRKFLDNDNFDEEVKLLDENLQSTNKAYEQYWREALLKEKDFIIKEKSEMKKVVAQLIEWLELQKSKYDSLTFVDMMH